MTNGLKERRIERKWKRKDWIQQHIIFREHAQTINNNIGIIADRDFYHKQADFVEYINNLLF